MKRVGRNPTFEEQIQYHLDDGRAPEFDKGQPGRVELARFLIDKIIASDPSVRTIYELGCGAGDISGPYSGERFQLNNEYRRRTTHYDDHISTSARIMPDIEVVGVDVTPAAAEACMRRWPEMTFLLSPVEQLEPQPCDILVMTEFLEHVDNPVSIVQNWLPLAKWAIIGHPLNEPDPPIEPGHIWSYTRDDWKRWWALGGHRVWEEFRFPMGGWDEMILGHGQRVLNQL